MKQRIKVAFAATVSTALLLFSAMTGSSKAGPGLCLSSRQSAYRAEVFSRRLQLIPAERSTSSISLGMLLMEICSTFIQTTAAAFFLVRSA